MTTRWARRRRHAAARGFILAEALVALSVAALTIALLTGATFGLRQTAMQPSVLQQQATDWLTARRVLQAWAGSATTDGFGTIESRFFGSPSEFRLIVDDSTSRSNRPVMIALRITQEDGLYRLSATRHFDVRDVRLGNEPIRASDVIVSDQPLSLVYYMAAGIGLNAQAWTYEPAPEQGLPYAVAIERGAERMIVAPMPATRSASCVSRQGLRGLEGQPCELR